MNGSLFYASVVKGLVALIRGIRYYGGYDEHILHDLLEHEDKVVQHQ